MKALSDGRLQPEPDVVKHLDLCLDCRACESACPSGVQYDKLIESTRQQVERRYQRTRGDRIFRELIFRIFPFPNRLRLLAAGLKPYHKLGLRGLLRASGLRRLLSERLQTLEDLTPDPPKTGPGHRGGEGAWWGCSPAACSASSSRT